MKSRFYQWLAWKLPKECVYYVGFRIGAFATTGKWSHIEVPKLTFQEAMERWDKPRKKTL
jgi:hypothetical protein